MGRMIADEWLKFAESDLKAARILSCHHPMQLEIICYHCQQATEKSLKAFLLFHECEPPKTHNLEYLVDSCKVICKDFVSIIAECEYLNPFGVQLRYPFGLDLTEDDATSSIQKCEMILDFVRNCLPQ